MSCFSPITYFTSQALYQHVCLQLVAKQTIVNPPHPDKVILAICHDNVRGRRTGMTATIHHTTANRPSFSFSQRHVLKKPQPSTLRDKAIIAVYLYFRQTYCNFLKGNFWCYNDERIISFFRYALDNEP